MPEMFRAFRSRNYRIIVPGTFVANVGTWLQRAAQDWLVIQLTDADPFALGITTALQFAPLLILGAWGGALSDRFPKRAIISAGTALQCIASVVLGTLVLTGHASFLLVGIFTFVFGVGTAFEIPARQSFVADLVPGTDVPNAVALNSASFNLARTMGPALAGILIAALADNTGPVFIVHAISTLGTFIPMAMVRPREMFGAGGKREASRLRDGFSYVRGRPDLILVLTIALFAGLFGLNFQVIIAMIAAGEFQLDAAGFGICSSLMAVGGVIGALTSAWRGRARLSSLVLWTSAFGLAVFVTAFAPTVELFGVGLVALGAIAMTVLPTSNALMQASAEPHMRGRVMGIYVVAIFAGTPVGAPLIGGLASIVGARWAVATGGLVLTVATVIAAALASRALGVKLRDVRPRWRGRHGPGASDEFTGTIDAPPN